MYAPSSVRADYKANKPGKLPAQSLQLEWVYGYRGHDCCSNLYYLPTGELVYFAAAVAVLYNVKECSQRHYLGHNDDIMCLAVHPDQIRVATGQVAGNDRQFKRQPCVMIWSSTTLQTLQVLGGDDFRGAVCCISFSVVDKGLHLVAVDKSCIMYVWDVSKEHARKITETKSSTNPDLAVEFHPSDNSRIVSCGKGQITFWQFDGKSLSKKQGVFGKTDRPTITHCIAFSPNGDAVSGDSNGNILVWGKGNTITKALTAAHPGGVFSLCFTEGGNLISGGKNRKIVEWDSSYNPTGREKELTKSQGPVRTLSCGMGRRGEAIVAGTKNNCIVWGSVDRDFSLLVQGHKMVKDSELWGLATHPSQKQFLTCGWDGLVSLWDVQSKSAVWVTQIDDEAHSCCFHPDGTVVAVGTRAPRFVVLDLATSEVVSVLTTGSEQIECLRYSPDGQYLAVGSRDNSIYIYRASHSGHQYNKLGRCSGHSSYVTHIDWSEDSQYIASNSGDYELLFWSASGCQQVTSGSSLRDARWSTQTCTWGFSAAGIWPEGADGTDINCCARNHRQSLLASGDDHGLVNLFHYPACQPRSPCHAYAGHSSHVTNVSFLFDDSRLVSTGGRDLAILQWKVV